MEKEVGMVIILVSMLIQVDSIGAIGDGSLFGTGEPSVSSIYRELNFPGPVKIDVVPVVSETLFNVGEIPPAVGDVKLDGVIKGIKKSSVYHKDRFFPGMYYKILSRGFRGDRYVVNLVLFPVQYNPVKKMIVKIKEFRVVETPLNINRTILSWEKDKTSTPGRCDMVIITDRRFVPVLDKLKTFKNSMGVHTRIVTLDWIYNNFKGVDNPERIRNFLKYAYTYMGVRYALLGGNEHVVPVRIVYCGSPYYGGEVITDLYYADLDGDWNRDGDGNFGEPEDSIDGYPDIAVGRLPFENEQEFEDYIDRVMVYEKEYPFRKNLVFMGASVYSRTDGWGQRNCEIIVDSIPYRFRDFIKLFNPPVDTVNHAWKGDEILNRYNAIAHLSSGSNVIAHFDHGDVWYTGTGIILGGSKVYSSDFQNMGINGVMLSVSCYSNAWDKESFGEGFLKFSGLGYLGNIKSGWTSQAIMERAFFEGIFKDSLYRLGDLWMKSLVGDIYFRYAFQLLGDPSLRVWWRRPDSLAVHSLPVNLKQGANSVGFVAEGKGRPAFGEGFIYQPSSGIFYSTQIVNGEGKIVATIPDTGMVIVGIISPEYYPVIDTVEVERAGTIVYIGASADEKRFHITMKSIEREPVHIRECGIIGKSGIIKVDSFPAEILPGEVFSVSGYVPVDMENISGNLSLKLTEVADSLVFPVFIPVKLPDIALHSIRIGEKGIVERIGIYNSGDTTSGSITYGFLWWKDGKKHALFRNHAPLLPGEGFVDDNPFMLPAEYDSIFLVLNREILPFSPEEPVDSVTDFEAIPGDSTCTIRFNTLVSNRYNLYIDGKVANHTPISEKIWEFTNIGYRPHVVVIRPVSPSFVEGLPVYIDTIYPNPPELQGWPVFAEYPDYIQQQETYNLPSPVAGDINGDGRKEVIVQMPSGRLYAYSGDGNLLPGYPIKAGTITRSSPSVFDIDGDGIDEVVLNGGLNDTADIRILNNGLLPLGTGRIGGMLYPVILLDGSIVYYTNDGFLHRVNHGGSEISGWPVYLPGVVCVGSGNLFADGNTEIVAGTSVGNKVYILSEDGVRIDSMVLSSRPMGIACGDFDGNQIDEIAVIELNGNLHVFRGSGEELSGFPFTQSHQIYADIGAGDVDGDGLPEVAFITKYGFLYVVDNDGTVLLMKKVPRVNYIRYVSPIIADLDGDGRNDVLVHSTDGKLYAFRMDGKDVPGFPIDIGSVSGSDPYVDDVDGDRNIELIARDDAGYIHMFKLQGYRVEWQTSGGNFARCRWYEFESKLNWDKSSYVKENILSFSPEIFKNKNVVVYDVSGRKVYSGKGVKGLPSGVFFVKSERVMKKILVIR